MQTQIEKYGFGPGPYHFLVRDLMAAGAVPVSALHLGAMYQGRDIRGIGIAVVDESTPFPVATGASCQRCPVELTDSQTVSSLRVGNAALYKRSSRVKSR